MLYFEELFVELFFIIFCIINIMKRDYGFFFLIIMSWRVGFRIILNNYFNWFWLFMIVYENEDRLLWDLLKIEDLGGN